MTWTGKLAEVLESVEKTEGSAGREMVEGALQSRLVPAERLSQVFTANGHAVSASTIRTQRRQNGV